MDSVAAKALASFTELVADWHWEDKSMEVRENNVSDVGFERGAGITGDLPSSSLLDTHNSSKLPFTDSEQEAMAAFHRMKNECRERMSASSKDTLATLRKCVQQVKGYIP